MMPKSRVAKRPRLEEPQPSGSRTPKTRKRVVVGRSKSKTAEPKRKQPKIPKGTGTEETSELNCGGQNEAEIDSVSASQSTAQKQGPKFTKIGNYNVKIAGDKKDCWITGIVVAEDGRKILADRNNKKVKLFSKDMEILSSVSLGEEPWDIVMNSEDEAVVTCGSLLVTLYVFEKKLQIKFNTKFSFEMRGICKYNETFIVTSPFEDPSCVKAVDRVGRTHWSVTSDQEQPLFISPLYLSSHVDDRSSLVVTDGQKRTLVLLQGDTGQVISNREMKGKEPGGIATDKNGNIYVCDGVKHNVTVLTEEMSAEEIILSRKTGLSTAPQAVCFDTSTQQLIVSYSVWNIKFRDTVGIFELAK